MSRLPNIRFRAVMLVTAALLAPSVGTASPGPPPDAAPAAGPAFQAELRVEEPGFDSSLRLRFYHDPEFINVPASAGHLFLVAADSARGEETFFIPSDLAFELGETQLYIVEFEQASDFFGGALGGRLRPGETQLGFILLPAAVELGGYLPGDPDSVVIRYANHRTSLEPATPEGRAWWRNTVDPRLLSVGLAGWWDWTQATEEAPSMSKSEQLFLAERLFPGQGRILEEEEMSAVALRNAILRVGDRRLLDSPVRQRVAPRYPAAVRQAGLDGLVIALCYITPEGEVGDALLLASNTVHFLNLAALSAAMDWRFAPVRGQFGAKSDGWRLLPFRFQLTGTDLAAQGGEPSGNAGGVGYEPPRIVRMPEPEYPEKARNKGLRGTVVYRVTISAEGKLVEARLEESLHPLLDEPSLVAIEHALFLPATRNGVPVRAEFLVPFTFGSER
jgi:protein TonB